MPLDLSARKRMTLAALPVVLLVVLSIVNSACSSVARSLQNEPVHETGADDSWLSYPPASDYLRRNDGFVSNKEHYEVVASAVDAVIDGYLGDAEYRRLDESNARHFTGEYFSCPVGKRTYLVRAAYVHGLTGGYRLVRVGNSLIVYHESLGPDTGFHKSAIVVNLEFELESVFTVAKVFQ